MGTEILLNIVLFKFSKRKWNRFEGTHKTAVWSRHFQFTIFPFEDGTVQQLWNQITQEENVSKLLW